MLNADDNVNEQQRPRLDEPAEGYGVAAPFGYVADATLRWGRLRRHIEFPANVPFDGRQLAAWVERAVPLEDRNFLTQKMLYYLGLAQEPITLTTAESNQMKYVLAYQKNMQITYEMLEELQQILPSPPAEGGFGGQFVETGMRGFDIQNEQLN